MKDTSEQILYIGKARDLKKRLSSYTGISKNEQNKTTLMINKVAGIDTILTNTEKEALILEASLIKKYKPKYNVILRDDKNYPYIKVTIQEKWPRVFMTRRRQRDKARYFGPFSSSSAMWKTLNYLNLLYPLRRCSSKKFSHRSRPCLNHQLGRCLAPCVGLADHQHYMELVNNVLMALDGKNKQLIHELKKQMKRASTELNFEEAALCRDRIEALTKTLEKQLITASHFSDQDVFGYSKIDGAVALSILFVRSGILTGNKSFYLAEPAGEDHEILAQVLNRFYNEENPVPYEILLPFTTQEDQLLSEWLNEIRAGRVYLKIPQRGAKFNLLKMAETNARQIHEDRQKKVQTWEKLAADTQKNLRLKNIPHRIECLDISNIGSSQPVGSLVSFINGEKDKSSYRQYKIRTIEGPDDYGMMSEVLSRRFDNKSKDSKVQTVNLPDLLIVDGGKGHLNIAVKVMKDLQLATAIDLVGIAKEREQDGDKLYRPGRKNPIQLARHNPVLLFLMRIRDEAHRFGITFHRKLRHKETIKSQLDQIPGIGPAKKQLLLKTFGSVKSIKAASTDSLSQIPGINLQLAKTVLLHLNK